MSVIYYYKMQPQLELECLKDNQDNKYIKLWTYI